jgi:hypothetical protein
VQFRASKFSFDFMRFSLPKLDSYKKVTKCYEKLVQEILMKLSSKQGNREQLRMLFNDVDEKFAIILSRKARKSKQIKKHFELLDEFGAEVMAEAKCVLREAVFNCMNRAWMLNHAENRKFAGNNVEMKKKVFFKYMLSFTKELKNGEISPLIDREEVMGMDLFQN